MLNHIFINLFYTKQGTGNEATDARRKRKEKLEKKGIIKPEGVFNNSLVNVPKYSNSDNQKERELPIFLVKIIKMIESKIETVGLYRVNGDASEVQQIRYPHFGPLQLNTQGESCQ